jgi:hypothetical protein
LLPKPLDIEPNKRYVKEICKSYDKLVNEELHDDAIGMRLDTEVVLHFCQLLG